MNFLLTGGAVFRDGTFQNVDVAISKGRIVSVSPSLSQEGFSVIECQDQVIVQVSLMYMFIFGSLDFLIRKPSPPARRRPPQEATRRCAPCPT